jgi:hypothetical protein
MRRKWPTPARVDQRRSRRGGCCLPGRAPNAMDLPVRSRPCPTEAPGTARSDHTVNDPYLPAAVLLKPNLEIHAEWDGYWLLGRPRSNSCAKASAISAANCAVTGSGRRRELVLAGAGHRGIGGRGRERHRGRRDVACRMKRPPAAAGAHMRRAPTPASSVPMAPRRRCLLTAPRPERSSPSTTWRCERTGDRALRVRVALASGSLLRSVRKSFSGA